MNWEPKGWGDCIREAVAKMKCTTPNAVSITSGSVTGGVTVNVHVIRPGVPAVRTIAGVGPRSEYAWADCVRETIEKSKQLRSELVECEAKLAALLEPARGVA